MIEVRQIYIDEVKQIREAISVARYRAAKLANGEMLCLYYSVGKFISLNTRSAKWGSGALKSISNQLQQEMPSLKGFSEGNMRKMRLFYEAWQPVFEPQDESMFDIVPVIDHIELIDFRSQPANELDKELLRCFLTVGFDNHIRIIVSFEMTQIPPMLLKTGWTNHQIILRACSTPEQYIFYILYAEYEHLQNKELERAIKTDAYSRVLSDKKFQSQMLKAVYPKAEVLLKDGAVLDMLGLPRKYKESKLRKGIIEHMKDFILEMGKDFLYIDREHQLEVGGQIFRCDLLFYHRALQCLVAIELKTTKFDPRDLGQLEFYLEALDQTERRSNENPSIGILMCKDANPEVVRYALNRSMSPMMVSRYEEQLQIGSVLQRSLEEFVNFIEDK